MRRRTYTEDWDFRESNTKEFTHTYHAYPAMMIPQIARKLIEEYRPEGKLELIFDPYMGSGTTLVEAKILGINSKGTDINPLARLITKTKVTNYNSERIEYLISLLKESLNNYVPNYDYNLDNITNIEFWYHKDRASELVYLTSLIENLVENENQDFFKIALSECVREVSYTRNGEFKRYRIAEEKINSFNPNTFKLFFEKLNKNLRGLREFNTTNTHCQSDVYCFNTVNDIPSQYIEDYSVDLVVTSPPYGDSKTTVAYGQFSRWANEWFNFENAKNLDSVLMGGKKIKEYILNTEIISNELSQIKQIDKKRYKEVLDFLDDYYKSIINVAKKVRIGGRICYVVGNRNVKGIQIPLDYFTIESFEKSGFIHINTFVRGIPNKRMPHTTSPSNKKGVNVSTMMNEFIIIMEKVEL